jgi:ABC-type sugar transport system ATPase subunit
VSEAAGAGIRIRNVAKRYGSTVALDGIDIDLRPGAVIGIAGPNGAGTSTLIRMIAGEERPDSGTLTFDGRPWFPAVDWHDVAVVHQEPQLFPNLTVAENVLVGREGTRTLRPRLGLGDAGVMQALGIARLKDALLEDCSLATQQRTEIARAVAREARVFLFDEPNSALTDEESDELFREMHKLAAEGRIVLLVTHRLGDIVEHAGRVAIVRDGKVR